MKDKSSAPGLELAFVTGGNDMSIIERIRSWLKPKPDIYYWHPPSDWNDHEGWERNFAAIYPKLDTTGWMADDYEIFAIFDNDVPRFVASLRTKECSRIWIPGCGMSSIPILLADFEFEVHATDISPTALEFQQTRYLDNSGPDFGESVIPEQQSDWLTCKFHDFRSAYLEDYFDLVINVKSFSGFDKETMRQVARSHYQSLKPGRLAYFLTRNVEDERLEIMEDCLVDAGFIIPRLELQRWLRQKLREAGISSSSTPVSWMSDEAKLQRFESIGNEYEAKAEIEKADKLIPTEAKLASITNLTV